MTRIHSPQYQSISEYRDIGSFRVVEQNVNPNLRSTVAAVDHTAKWSLTKLLILIFGIAALFGLIAFVGIALNAQSGKEEVDPKNAEKLKRLLSGLSLFPFAKVVAT